MQHTSYGQLADGSPVDQWLLDNGCGLRLSVLSLGGIVNGLWLGETNLCLGFDTLDDYLQRNPFFGVIVGRYGNRIAGGALSIDGQRFQLSQNDGSNCLHGGADGFGTQLWNIEPDTPQDGEAAALLLRRRSPDGEQGFPGNLDVQVRYALAADENSWRVDYEARCDAPTVVNLTQHAYFNLAGGGSVLEHELRLPASRFCAIDAALIPNGHAEVAGTPFDFRAPRAIGQSIDDTHEQLRLASGYDHHWLLDAPFDGSLRLAAEVREPQSGRRLELFTSEPGLQFYAGNFLDGSLVGHGGRRYRRREGFCLEPQHAPDSPNRAPSADWPSTLLRPGEVYRSRSVYRFTQALTAASATLVR